MGSNWLTKGQQGNRKIPDVKEAQKMKCVDSEDTCNITNDSTCCFECSNLKKCREEGNGVCDRVNCEKHEDYEGEPCECPMCTLETELADALEEIDELKDELLNTQCELIEAQREILRLSREPQVWQ